MEASPCQSSGTNMDSSLVYMCILTLLSGLSCGWTDSYADVVGGSCDICSNTISGLIFSYMYTVWTRTFV